MPADLPQPHFVAEVKVTKVEHRGQIMSNPARVKSTIARLTFSAADLETLTDKVGKHLELIEDGGDVDESR